jgi:predicted dehydrogenase
MSFSVKVFGAGSIGNHLAHASRALGWRVDMCDIDPRALERTRAQIYPGRYGKWDESIRLFSSDTAPKGEYDIVVIGTPPDTHISLALRALQETPRAILIEKPICGPGLEGVGALLEEARARKVALFVGYDHVVGKAARIVSDLAVRPELGSVRTLDVEFREFWGGIFAAHPWLSGPWETYLGFSQRGGGAVGEHSHAVNLWQYFARIVGAGRIIDVQAVLDFVRDGRVDYDRICLMNFRTESGMVGRCVQDVVTQPPRKWARIQYDRGNIEWHCGRQPGVDAVSAQMPGGVAVEHSVTKTRPDDFIEELRHIEAALASDPEASPIAFSHGIATMLVIAAAHMSHETGRRVRIDHSKKPGPEALTAI